MMALTLKQISDALGISRSRVDQWISRGYFRTPDKPLLGKARAWDVSDAVRLSIMEMLIGKKVTAEEAGRALQFAPPIYTDEQSYLVLWNGVHETAIKDQYYYSPNDLYTKRLRESELAAFITDPHVHFSVVVNLNHVLKDVEKKLSRLENVKASIPKTGAGYDA